MICTVHGILQARILEGVAFPFSRGSSQPRDRTQVSRIAGRFSTSWVKREAQSITNLYGIRRNLPGWFGSSLHCVELNSKMWAEDICPQRGICLLSFPRGSQKQPLVECRHPEGSDLPPKRAVQGLNWGERRCPPIWAQILTLSSWHPSLLWWWRCYFHFPTGTLCILCSNESET